MAAMSRSAHRLPARFVLYWTVATTIGLSVSLPGATIAGVIALLSLDGPGPGWTALLAALALALTTPLGISQWVVLRRTWLDTPLWIPATMIGFTIGSVAGAAALSTIGIGGFGALLGASIGFAQSLILKRHLKRSGLWILATTAATAAAYVPAVALVRHFFGPYRYAEWPPLPAILLGVVSGSALFGAATGLLLRWLVRLSRGGE